MYFAIHQIESCQEDSVYHTSNNQIQVYKWVLAQCQGSLLQCAMREGNQH